MIEFARHKNSSCGLIALVALKSLLFSKKQCYKDNVTIDPRYLEQLNSLSGIKSFQLDMSASLTYDAVLLIESKAGKQRLLVHQYRSHLTHKIADQLLARAEPEQDLLLLAPHVGNRLAAKLEEAGVNYLDQNGNCHIELGPLFIHVEGRRSAPVARVDKGLRSAGYQVLFTYLAAPSLINETVRSVAELAGVSTRPVHDMKHRLLEEEFVVKTRSSIKWVPRRRQDALNLWLHGYETTVRPSLVWATLRTRDTPDELEAHLPTVLQTMGVSEYRWGGTSAGFRLTGHYRGERTTVHIHSLPGDFRKRLKGVTDPSGNLVLMNAVGDLNWQPDQETAHPLLVYSEMLSERNERAREAAQDVFEKFILPGWGETA